MAKNKKFYNAFEFVGALSLSNKEDKRLVTTTVGTKGWEKHKLNLSVKESQSNSAFLTMEHMLPSDKSKAIVYTGKKDGTNVQIPFESRNEDYVKDVIADYRKITIDLERDPEVIKERISYILKIVNINKREDKTEEDNEKLIEYDAKIKELSHNKHEFLTMYDVMHFINDNYDTLKGFKFKVTGNVIKSEYKGKYYTSFEPKAFMIVDEETPSKLQMDLDIYFDKSALTVSKDGLELSGYLINRDNVAKEDKAFPHTFVMNKTEENGQIVDIFKEFLTVKGKSVYHQVWKVDLLRGAEVKEATMDDLTPSQKKLVLAGVYNADFFLKGKNTYGDNVEEYRLSAPVLDGEFEDGAVEYMDIKEFEETMVAVSTGDKTVEEVKEEKARVEEVKVEDIVKETEAQRKLRMALFGN